jgi:hypothetical protein
MPATIRTPVTACALCDQTGGGGSTYDHVHRVETLPSPRRSDDCVKTRGYAVQFSGPARHGVPSCWVFFTDREPALVFGRAGRMTDHINGYGVHEAVHEFRYDDRRRDHIATLYVTTDRIDGQPDERDDLRRWVEGAIAGFTRFHPGAV